MNINWYPGHMTKAKRELQAKLKLIDLVIEVIDARAPRCTVNPDFERMFQGKGRMYILNKADMADPQMTKAWVAYYRSQGVFCVSYSVVKGNPKQLQQEIEACAGEIYEKYAQKGMKKTVRSLVCGIPNVGKSAILNRLAGGRKLKEGNQPGVTRGLAWAKLTPYLELMDSPGLLWPKIGDERTGAIIAALGSIRQEILDEEQLAYYLIELLKENFASLLVDRYQLETVDKDPWKILEDICRRRGFLQKGGVADTERGAKVLLEEFRNGKLGRLTLERP